MKRLIGSLALVVVLAVAGCGPGAKYCSTCEAGVSQSGPDAKVRLIRGRCTVNGREIDCTREHSYCPEFRGK